MNINSALLKDFYKTGHIFQYPDGVEEVYSNLTARISRMENVDRVVVFGINYFIQRYLVEHYNENFFSVSRDEIERTYRRRMRHSIGLINIDHILALHDLGYLPVHIKALPEGSLCPLRIPLLTIRNTHPKFAWITNFLETLLSNALWHPITTATIAFQYRKVLEEYATRTSDIPEFVKWQGHDFSMRGQTSLESSCVNGGAHLTSFTGTDTIPAIDWLETYYNADCETELIGGSVPATEHSVMCLGGQETERETYLRLITKAYPKGVISIVSDTWDYWKILTETLPSLRSEIMSRDGKLVVRPDSGDPVKIICGNPFAFKNPEKKGTIQLLWDAFGGTVNSKGYKQLDPHIGVIYGDSITVDRCKEILRLLELDGFASTNVVFGIGSYTYQYVTRDTFGFAMKATWGRINGKPIEIFKDPLTDGGVKKSAKGLLRVNEDFSLSECVTEEEEKTGLLETVFIDGSHNPKQTSLRQIRNKIDGHFA